MNPTRRTLLVSAVAAPVLAAPALGLGGCAAAPAAAVPSTDGQHAWSLAVPGLPEPVRILLSLPRGYHAAPATRWPLVLFMHGSGERGTKLEVVAYNGPPKLAAAGTDYPFILVSPQLDDGQRWQTLGLHMLLGTLLATLRADPDRVIATGLSLGGMVAWEWAAAYPDELAAIVPVSGVGEPEDVCRAAKVPVRAYHGAIDDVVPLQGEIDCVKALQGCGGQVEHIIYPGVGHDAWTPAYADPQLVPWMLAQRRKR